MRLTLTALAIVAAAASVGCGKKAENSTPPAAVEPTTVEPATTG